MENEKSSVDIISKKGKKGARSARVAASGSVAKRKTSTWNLGGNPLKMSHKFWGMQTRTVIAIKLDASKTTTSPAWPNQFEGVKIKSHGCPRASWGGGRGEVIRKKGG